VVFAPFVFFLLFCVTVFVVGDRLLSAFFCAAHGGGGHAQAVTAATTSHHQNTQPTKEKTKYSMMSVVSGICVP
jgi:hypothetical protein